VIEKLVQNAEDLYQTVKLDSGRVIVPTEDDFTKILDEAARVLYDEPIGSTLRIARLIIEKQDGYLDVYQHIGTYN
jgi:hypothetical protein